MGDNHNTRNTTTPNGWMHQGACRTGEWPTILFDSPADPEQEDVAKEVCRTCDHQHDCLVWVMAEEERNARGEWPIHRYGIHAATTPTDREGLYLELLDVEDILAEAGALAAEIDTAREAHMRAWHTEHHSDP